MKNNFLTILMLHATFSSGISAQNTKPNLTNVMGNNKQMIEIDIEKMVLGSGNVLVVNKNITWEISFELESAEPVSISDEFQYALGIVPDIKAKKLKWLKIYCNGAIITLPRTSYDQLFQIKIIRFRANAFGLAVNIFGGDSGDAYKCVLSLSRDRLTRKIIGPLDKIAAHASEITIYKSSPEVEKTGR